MEHKSPFTDLNFEYRKPNNEEEKKRLYHEACSDEFAGWSEWFSGNVPKYFWEGLKKTAAITGTYDVAWLSVITGNFENIEEAEKVFGDLKVSREMIKMFMSLERDIDEYTK
jgi:hypothetical protein